MMPVPPEFRVVFARGVAVLVVAIFLHVFERSVLQTGETYALLRGQFASKREVAIVSLGFLFGGAYFTGLVHGWIVNVLKQPGYFEVGLGLGLWTIILFTNEQVENWKPLNGGDPVFWTLAVAGFVLIASGLA